ncbi:MAG: metal ABC transporter substrate-binding protein [Roseiflexaceae bacterium]|nr:metal ABC transporter substrate-binding protein [Roseiflexaceae bacterium]
MRITFLFITLASMLMAACGQSAPSATSSNTAGQPKRILATFTVIADIAENVAGDAAIVESITKIGTEIHDYEPTPSDIVRAQKADLILNNGLGLERWFEKFLGAVKDVPAVDVSTGITPIPIAEGPYQNKPNPHAWMSLTNAKIYVENIRKALVELDPANAATYNANAAAYIAKFQPLEDQLKQQISAVPANQRALVTCEGAFSYFARDAGLKEVYMWAINADQEGTPEQVKSVIDTVRANKYPVLFCESTVNAKAMQQVASETGAHFGGTLYVDSLTAANGDAPSYLAMLTFNVAAIARNYAEARK